MPNAWRDKAAPIIATILRRTEGMSEKEIKKALHDAYALYDPSQLREMWPYKVWLDEIQRQRNLKSKKPHDKRGKLLPVDESQERMF